MYKFLFLIFLITTTMSCTAHDKSKRDSYDKEEMKTSQPVSEFYLLRNIADVLKDMKLNKDSAEKSDIPTCAGYVVFASDMHHLLKGLGLGLDSSFGKQSKIILHIGSVDKATGPLNHEVNDIIGATQINIYENDIANKFKNSLVIKYGKPIFDTSEIHQEAIIENNVLKPGNKNVKRTVAIWKSDKYIIYYIENSPGDPKKSLATVFAFTPTEDEWPLFLSNVLSFPYIEKIK